MPIPDEHEILGKLEEEAEKILSDKDFILRVQKRNGFATMCTNEVKFNRVNVRVVDGIVTEIAGRG